MSVDMDSFSGEKPNCLQNLTTDDQSSSAVVYQYSLVNHADRYESNRINTNVLYEININNCESMT